MVCVVGRFRPKPWPRGNAEKIPSLVLDRKEVTEVAKVKDPFGAREASGSVGGITAGRNYVGVYVRARGGRAYKLTENQGLVRAVMQRLAREYQDLERWEMDLWRDFGAEYGVELSIGSGHGLCGCGAYTRSNYHRSRMGLASNRTPPPNPGGNYSGSVSLREYPQGIGLDVLPRPMREQAVLYRTGIRQGVPGWWGRGPWRSGRYLREDAAWPEIVFGRRDIWGYEANYRVQTKFIDDFGRATKWAVDGMVLGD